MDTRSAGNFWVWVCIYLEKHWGMDHVCPLWNSRHFGTTGWRIAFGLAAILISISTVFLKQHSLVDIIAAIPICVIAYMASFKEYKKGKNCDETGNRIQEI